MICASWIVNKLNSTNGLFPLNKVKLKENRKEIRVLNISSAGPKTGAGIAAMTIHLAFMRHGIESKYLHIGTVAEGESEIYSYSDTLLARIRRFVITQLEFLPVRFYANRKNQIFSTGFLGMSLKNHPLVEWSTIIHLNWVNHGLICMKELKSLRKPIIWTMHDMWVFTGGCHQSFSCKLFILDCGTCPVLNSKRKHDLSYYVLKCKFKNIPVDKISWVTISSWMKENAESSKLLRNQSISVIHPGINTKIFKPILKRNARNNIGIPLIGKVILLGATDLYDPYKGSQFGISALKSLSNDIRLITFGRSRIKNDEIPIEVRNFGFINEPEMLALLYSAADIFLAPSIAEGFGMTMAEAQCCGTPVVAFNHSGPKDIVEHIETGYLAEPFSVSDLSFGIEFCLNHEFNVKHISERATKLFSTEATIDYYKQLFLSHLI